MKMWHTTSNRLSSAASGIGRWRDGGLVSFRFTSFNLIHSGPTECNAMHVAKQKYWNL